jgi:tellurite resistance protein
VTRQSVRHLPVGMFGAVMGLAGLGLSARLAAPLFPGTLRAPAYFTELWVGLGALALAVLLPAYLAKLIRYPGAVREEFVQPVQLGFCGTLPLALALVGGGVGPYAPQWGSALWWAGVAMLLALQIWALSRWLAGGIELAQVNAGWMIVLIGGIVVPGPGLALGHGEAARFMFGVSAAVAPLLMALVFARAVVGPALPEAMRPSWFILLVPPALVYAHGEVFYRLEALETLFFLAVVLVLALLVYARRFLRWAFGPPWWSFTFPLDALAWASARYAQNHPEPAWKAVAAASLLLATIFVALVLAMTALAFLRGTLLAPPAGAPSPRSASSPAA